MIFELACLCIGTLVFAKLRTYPIKTIIKKKIVKGKIMYKIGTSLLKIYIHQKMYKNIKQITKTFYMVECVIYCQTYRIPIKVHRGFCPILQVTNEKQDDITEILIQHAGPNYDFFNYEYTPIYFNCDEITIELSNCQTIVFTKNEILKLDKFI